MTTPAAGDGGRRLLLVHAHPDDETLTTGSTMAAAADAGVAVTLVTCTRGELGQVLPADLAHLRGDPEALGAHREGELAAATAVLGVPDHRFLGVERLPAGAVEVARYRDSGMVTLPSGLAGVPDELLPGAFAAADLDAAAAHLARVVREVRPHAVVTYDPGGGYGHPDHVMAHRVTLRAVDLAVSAGPGGSAWAVPAVLAPAWPRGLVVGSLRAARAAGDTSGPDPDGPLPSIVTDEADIAVTVPGEDLVGRKMTALACHRSQMVVDRVARTATQEDGFAQPVLGTEWYRLLRGRAGPEGTSADPVAGLFPPSATGPRPPSRDPAATGREGAAARG